MCAIMTADDKTVHQKAEALRSAITRHGNITKDAMMGEGIDRLLFGLRKMGDERGSPTDPVFTTDAHKIWDEIIISTSTLASPVSQRGLQEGCKGRVCES
jgi:hypothetical protein